ncbi:MAG: asparagine synthetase B [Candidatus Lindowbacteria bacterium RIFCSPLOWO2_12_FULL_62_27]|nr:MAG: asparagine synthetase B [Candidatus Lindowbacteria bacterium RIFCSPLOWO2_02_FULL_62_12]OGH60632.1 MAG: asparagine synthetase B [Candidatus Lindowbacteria bacterium RIFCSPLOWO2_12_FULL_62_27]
MRKALPAALALCLLLPPSFSAAELLIPMDAAQSDHLRAYGLVYDYLKSSGSRAGKSWWLLNIRGGAFLLPDDAAVSERAVDWGVTVEVATQADIAQMELQVERSNAAKILLEKAPRIGVYAPPFQEMWDDAVMLVLNYAKIPYETFYDKEVLEGRLGRYDWVHMHHDDFTGQFGKFYRSYKSFPWYIRMVDVQTKIARDLGFATVPKLKAEVARRIAAYVENGGFLFAMCAAIDSFDIALAAQGIDIVPELLDGSPTTPDLQNKLDFSKTMAFKNFTVSLEPNEYEFSDIDISIYENSPDREAFALFPFSAKYDPVPTMLTQSHESLVAGFFGQTTSFKRPTVKPHVILMATVVASDRAKYIYGSYGKGLFSFLGGHDPEDFSHIVGEAPTDVSLYKHSPGYRLILNNILFPAAKKQERKT